MMGVLRGEVAAKHMRDVFMEIITNQHGAPLKEWHNSPEFEARMDKEFEQMTDTCKQCGAPLPVGGQPYPSRHPRGSSWCGDEAWDIMDRVPPEAISQDWRIILSGMIAGALSRVAVDPLARAEAWWRKRQ